MKNFFAVPTFLLSICLVACGGGGGNDSSSTSIPTETNVTVPGAPTISAITAGDTKAYIAYSAPSSNGGSAITNYDATCSASSNSISGSGSSSPITVTGLTNKVSYECSLTATNSKGVSEASSSVYITPESDTDFVAADWNEATHSKDADPNLSEVFDDTIVKRFDFVVSPERWQSMLDDMTAKYGAFGLRGSGPPSDDGEDPIFVPANVFYNGIQWYRVGIRFKGHSSLRSPWSSGILKLSFKMDFDEFEDDYPQIKNQRFYGFKKFSLKNNFNDESLLREKVASDVFANAGLAVSHTAFYSLYVNYGNGPEYFGLYTLVEEVDGTVLDTQFSSDDGNLYKPEGIGASFVAGTFSEDAFVKKTNEDDKDWSDILALFEALHNDSVSEAVWRSNLESIFDVDGFLKYLAVNGIIQNWDTYGLMRQNYYLYNNPETTKLTWIPWDNNEALQTGKHGGALALDFSNMNSTNWPLISKLYADDVYKAQYNTYLSEVINNAFHITTIHNLYDTYSYLVEPYASIERKGYSFLESANDFSNAVNGLKTHATNRANAVSEYLSTQQT